MAFSEVDFNRMQDQLIESREASYKKDENLKRYQKEIIFLKENLATLEKELSKANQVITRSKKMKEFEALFQELEQTRKKKEMQEEEARLQNDELMKQLTEFVTTNEKLSKENESLRGEKDLVKLNEFDKLQDQYRRLQAQYSALQKFNGSHLNTESLKHPEQNNVGDAGEEINNAENCDNGGDGGDNTLNDKENTVLKLRLQTEMEEKDLLKAQLSSRTSKHKEEMEKVQNELKKMEEKLKRKQESYLSLQESKDALLKEMNDRIAAEIKKIAANDLEGKCERLNNENKMLDASLNVFKTKCYDFESERSSAEKNLKLAQEELKKVREESKKEVAGVIEQKQRLIDEQKNLIDQMREQIRKSQLVNEKSVQEIKFLQKEREKLSESLKGMSKVADSRKQHLDTMAIKYNELIDTSKEQLEKVTEHHEKSLQKNCIEVESLKSELKDLRGMKEECHSVKELLKEVQVEKSRLEVALESLKNEKDTEAKAHIQEIESINSSHQRDSLLQQQKHQNEIKDYETLLEESKHKNESLHQKLNQKESIIKDHGEDKKLHEKKGNTVLKDLKKQLELERKRADKMQEKLQGVLLDTKNRQSVEDLFRPSELRHRPSDNSSLSSWSPSGASRDIFQGGDEEVEGRLKGENEELIRKITQLQQAMCLQKEKVAHLEASNAAMAGDLLEKTAIIKHYHMPNKPDQSNVTNNHENPFFKKFTKLVGDHEKSDSNETSRKLQNIIEETLTKNMHLQNDVELLSKELAELKRS